MDRKVLMILDELATQENIDVIAKIRLLAESSPSQAYQVAKELDQLRPGSIVAREGLVLKP